MVKLLHQDVYKIEKRSTVGRRAKNLAYIKVGDYLEQKKEAGKFRLNLIARDSSLITLLFTNKDYLQA